MRVTLVLVAGFGLGSLLFGEDGARPNSAATALQNGAAVPAAADGLTPLNRSGTVLADLKGKRLIVMSEVVLREGLLEMLVCLKQTKEHESVLAVDAKAQMIHAGLLLLNAEPGTPARFVPEYQPATGQALDIFLSWTDDKGVAHRERAQSWVRHATRRYFVHKLDTGLPRGLVIPPDSELKWDDRRKELLWYGTMSSADRERLLKLSAEAPYQAAIKALFDQSQVRPMKADWVFAGSGFNVDPETGQRSYLAESGDLVCVANFATATIDLSIPSSAANDDLLYEAYTERIPPVGTKVQIELIPIFKKPAPAASAPSK